MKNVLLVRLDPAIEETIANHPEYMAALAQDNWAHVADLIHRVVGRTLTALPVSVDELHWSGYFVVDEGTREVIGSSDGTSCRSHRNHRQRRERGGTLLRSAATAAGLRFAAPERGDVRRAREARDLV